MDYDKQIQSVSRSLRKQRTADNESRLIVLVQTFPFSKDDIWDAVTSPSRLKKWFAAVSGDLHIQGHYSITGNASGTITECDKPSHFQLSWTCGDTSTVRVELATPKEGQNNTTLTLLHTLDVNDHWRKYGAGAAGVGWDMSFAGLALHLEKLPKPTEEEWAASEDAKEFTRKSSAAWMKAAVDGGEDEAWSKAVCEKTTAFYVPMV